MCDYSLQMLKSRPAVVGETLQTSQFQGTASHGFASPAEADTAVCVLPGTEIAFDKPVEKRKFLWAGFGSMYASGAQTSEETIQCLTARFRQIDTENTHTHHDALEFADGTIVKLHDLQHGQSCKVLQLPAAPKNEQEAKEQTRLEVVA